MIKDMIQKPSFLLTLCILIFMGGCSSKKLGGDDEYAGVPAEELYQNAEKALADEDFEEASKLFSEVEQQHPYSALAEKAELQSAYALYLDEKYDEAIIALDRYIELHPAGKQVDYAYYLKALSHYDQIGDVKRDLDSAKMADAAFDTLIQRFPQSQYAKDAMLKRDLAKDHLAGKEMDVGRYYQQQNQLNAAINRFTVVVQEYDTTSHTPEALHRLVECYLTLGLDTEARHIAAVLGHNYPNSPWYEASYKLMDPAMREQLLKDVSLKDKAIDTLLQP
jgi:outer membrane protein assembly factor BamD